MTEVMRVTVVKAPAWHHVAEIEMMRDAIPTPMHGIDASWSLR